MEFEIDREFYSFEDSSAFKVWLQYFVINLLSFSNTL